MVAHDQGGLKKIVQESRRRVILVSVFVLLFEFNRHRSKEFGSWREGE
jgi:hypothetical protein